MGKRAVELDPAEHAENAGPLAQDRQLLLTLGTGGTADDQEGGFGMEVLDSGKCLEQDIDPFERLDASDEEDHRARPKTQPAVGPIAAIPGRKTRWSTPGGEVHRRFGSAP